jgi:hypothetical protein
MGVQSLYYYEVEFLARIIQMSPFVETEVTTSMRVLHGLYCICLFCTLVFIGATGLITVCNLFFNGM